MLEEKTKTYELEQELDIVKNAFEELKADFDISPDSDTKRSLNQREMMEELPQAFNQNPLATQRTSLQKYLPNEFRPPILVQHLIEAKLKEKKLVNQVNQCLEKEKKARQDLQAALIEKLSLNKVDQQQIDQERLKRE